MATWGIPHPTGYPLYVLLGGIVSHIVPIGQLAFRLNLLSAACSAAAAVFVFLTVLRLSACFATVPPVLRYGVAVTAALVLASSREFWSQSILAEVYTLEALFVAALAFLLSDDSRNPRRLPLLALLAGLALTHHTTIVFSLVGGAAATIWRFQRRLLNPRLLATCAVLFLLPLCLYFLLPWRAGQHPASNLGDPSSFERFVDVVTGAPYRSYLDRSPFHVITALPAVFRLILGQFAWWTIPLAVAGGLRLWDENAPFALFAAIAVSLSCLWIAAYRAEGRETYLIQAYVLTAIAAGAGMLVLAEWLREALNPTWRRRLPAIAAIFSLVTILPWLLVGYRDFNLRDDWAAWHYAQATLGAATPGETLHTRTDEHTFALWYAQRAEHLRPDVHVIDDRWLDPLHQR